MALMLLGMVIALTFVNLKDSRGRVDSRALAEQISEELRLARQKAQVRGVPVAIAFPSLNGTVPHCRSFYVLEGDTQPRVTKAFNYGNENSAVMFNGFYPPDAGTNRAGLRTPGTPGERFRLNEWNSPYPDDPVFVFTPSGAVVSNQVSFGGAYHIVCSRGVQYHGAMVDSINSFQLDGVCQPWTVSLSTAGEVNVRDGITGGSSVTQLPEPPPGTPAPAMAIPPLGANNTPTVSVGVFPVPIAASLPPGIDATSRVDSYLLVKATAHDGDGDVLFCNWTATQGAFSNNQPTRMQWDPEKQEWFSYWNWQAPPGDMGTGVYNLTCTVDDRRGGTATGQLGVAGQLATLSPQQICFVGYDAGPPSPGNLMIMNIDGTEPYRLTEPPIDAGRPRWSPNGQKIAFLSPWGGASDLYIINRDGTELRQVCAAGSHGWDKIVDMDFNSDGNGFYVLAMHGATKDVYSVNMWGGGATLLTTTPIPVGGHDKISVGHNSDPAVDADFVVTTDGPNLLFIDTVTGIQTNVPVGGAYANGFFEPDLSRDSGKVVWQDSTGNNLYWSTLTLPPALGISAPALIRNSGAGMHTASFSPDASQIIYNENVGGGSVYDIRRCKLDGSDDSTLTIPHPTYSEDEGSWSSR